MSTEYLSFWFRFIAPIVNPDICYVSTTDTSLISTVVSAVTAAVTEILRTFRNTPFDIFSLPFKQPSYRINESESPEISRLEVLKNLHRKQKRAHLLLIAGALNSERRHKSFRISRLTEITKTW